MNYREEDRESMQQELLELHYGLLEDADAQRLKERILSEPELAELWAQTARVAERFADAAKLTGCPPLPASELDQLVDRAKRLEATPQASLCPRSLSDDTSAPPQTGGRPRGLFAVRSFLLAACVLTIIVGVRFWNALPPRPNSTVLLHAEPITGADATAENAFRVTTSQPDGPSYSLGSGPLPLTPAALTFSVHARGVQIFRQHATSSGEASFRLPDDLLLPSGALLRVEAHRGEGPAAVVEVPLRATRCLTFLSTDRPVYRPGETIFFRSLTLERQSLQGQYALPIRFELLDPSGTPVPGTTMDGVTDRGVGNGAFALPANLAGGSYTLVATSLDGFFPEERLTIAVREYRVPRFTKSVQLDHRSYGPADSVTAQATIRRVEGEPLAGARVSALAVVDGKTIASQQRTTDAQGNFRFTFALPALIRVGEGYLAFIIDDGGTRETLIESLPIQTDRVDIDFYPEGGYLVEGLRNRVYFAARSTQGEPVHIEGEIMTSGGRHVTRIATQRDGMGRFEFIPEPGQQYRVKLSKPLDVSTAATLPAVVTARPLLDTGRGVFAADAPLDFVLRTTQAARVRVQAVCRGLLVGEMQADLRPGSNPLRVPLSEQAAGVVRVTVFAADSRQPLAERLVFRRSGRELKVEVIGAQTQQPIPHSPGEPVRLTLQVSDEHDRPVAAVLGVSVVDQAALAMQTTEQPTLKTHFLLTSEVQQPEDLEHANFYLQDSAEAEASLDLLLGTQGWRRFVYEDAASGQESFEEQLQRLLQLDGPPAVVAAPQSNSRMLDAQWSQYRTAVDRAWTRLLDELRWLLLPLFLLWSLVAWLRARMATAATAMGLLLMACAAAPMTGCGAPEAVTSAVSRESADEQAAAPTSSEPSSPLMPAVAAPAEAAGIDQQPSAELPIAPPQPPLPTAVAAGDRAAAGDNRAPSEEASRPLLSEQDIQRLLAARGIDSEELARRLVDELRFPVREYAHRHTAAASREDFTETLFWQPLLMTDSEGRATIRFDLSDAVTSFQIRADAHAPSGRIGSGGGSIVARIPFQLEPQLPLVVTVGDRIDLPIAVINASDASLATSVKVSADSGLAVDADAEVQQASLAAGQRTRLHVPIQVEASAAGQRRSISVEGTAGEAGTLADQVRREVRVAAAGYPVRTSVAVTVNPSHRLPLEIPPDHVPGSLRITLRAYPSPLADLIAGVESILAEPHGCFEQASAANYPNALALQVLKRDGVSDSAAGRRAEEFLERGYEKLTRFECENRGYEWFGEDPGHEALSAFGLMQFNDMRSVMSIDLQMITRTRNWLLGRRDGDGGWKRNPRHLHSWSVQQEVVNAYVLWALTEADAAIGNSDASAVELRRELDRLETVAQASEDAYLLALSAAALATAGRPEAAERLLEKLTLQQADNGSLTGQVSVTQSGGKSLQVETTALAVIAWSKSASFAEPRQRAAQWLLASRDGSGGFGSTQATVLALKALLAIRQSAQVAGGRLMVSVDGQRLAEATLPQHASDEAMVEIEDLATRLLKADIDPQTATLELSLENAQRLPCTVEIAYHTPQPASDDQTAVRLETQLADHGSVAAGDIVPVDATLENVTGEGLPMTVAVIGLPGGLEPRAEELDELRDAGVFDYYELRPREVILYWRTIAPRESKTLRFHVTAAIPGSYTAPASRAYLYYTAERVHWTAPLSIEIRR